MSTITDLYNRCVQFQKDSGSLLYPSTVDTIAELLSCKTSINHDNWEDLTLEVVDGDTNTTIGYVSFDWYFSSKISFYNADFVILHEYQLKVVVSN